MNFAISSQKEILIIVRNARICVRVSTSPCIWNRLGIEFCAHWTVARCTFRSAPNDCGDLAQNFYKGDITLERIPHRYAFDGATCVAAAAQGCVARRDPWTRPIAIEKLLGVSYPAILNEARNERTATSHHCTETRCQCVTWWIFFYTNFGTSNALHFRLTLRCAVQCAILLNQITRS